MKGFVSSGQSKDVNNFNHPKALKGKACAPKTTKAPFLPTTTKAPLGQCNAETCQNGLSIPDCSSNQNCYCFTTINDNGLCAETQSCSKLQSCDNCPSDFGVCLVNTCCHSPVCFPHSLVGNCTAPPTKQQHSIKLMNKPQQCKTDSECENGKTCKLHMTGMLCA